MVDCRSGAVVSVQSGAVHEARRLVAAVGRIDAGFARIMPMRCVLAAVAGVHLGVVVRMRMLRPAVGWVDARVVARVLLFGHFSLFSQLTQDCSPQNPFGVNKSSTSSVARLASYTRSSTV